LRVGFVGVQPSDAPIYVAFRKRMAELGYREDRYFEFEYIQTPSIDAYDASFRELVARKPDIVIAAGSEPALRAARAAAGALPIVFLAIDFDPVAKGYVASLARPGGNITGIFVHPLELATKRIELVREALPQARYLGLIWSRDQAEAAATAAKFLGFEPRSIEVTGEPPDYAAAIREMADVPGEPIVIPAGPIFLRDRAAIGRLLLEQRIPAIGAFREIVEAGAVMSYGIDLVGLFRDVASIVENLGLRPPRLELVEMRIAHDLNLLAGQMAILRRAGQEDLDADIPLGFIYSKAGEELIAQVNSDLKSGQYSPGVPLTIEVPKSFRIRVAVPAKRLGPSFSRPGSILLPHDRLLYQALADQAAPIIADKTDNTRSFSHQLGDPDSASMFLPTRTCWSALQKALAKHATEDTNKYILRVDVANFFGSLNLHTLINVLNDSTSTCSWKASKRLINFCEN
jgi:putative tryptophan/tyrosine transport system substrate-binding protein